MPKQDSRLCLEYDSHLHGSSFILTRNLQHVQTAAGCSYIDTDRSLSRSQTCM